MVNCSYFLSFSVSISRHFPRKICSSSIALCSKETTFSVGSQATRAQCRFSSHNNSVSVLQQFYNHLPIRKKYRRALKRGTLIWDKGQMKIPPVGTPVLNSFKLSAFDKQVPFGKSSKTRFERLKALVLLQSVTKVEDHVIVTAIKAGPRSDLTWNREFWLVTDTYIVCC
ncbi:hypothetical protein IE077_003244 [Cardiosporidium cionae]|uniref:Uncharacterized protein n=1 Tax=Cardiosporidium cionae TaxID=476202 RepID=A0ABQ7JF50_9APIC|nr:hypothetical protein IE077_003244 [Cardiosporidium cionae]|eukprot:KAF8822646.1 hypothetical protein IE077_003244 [Cardiosporidium cionae]